MPQSTEAQQSLMSLLQRSETSTQEVIAANRAYTQWSQVRTGCAKIAKRLSEAGHDSDEAFYPLLKVIEISTRKCEAIEAFCDKKRHLHEVLQFQIEQLEHELA